MVHDNTLVQLSFVTFWWSVECVFAVPVLHLHLAPGVVDVVTVLQWQWSCAGADMHRGCGQRHAHPREMVPCQRSQGGREV